jgi:hypothetical protein
LKKLITQSQALQNCEFTIRRYESHEYWFRILNITHILVVVATGPMDKSYWIHYFNPSQKNWWAKLIPDLIPNNSEDEEEDINPTLTLSFSGDEVLISPTGVDLGNHKKDLRSDTCTIQIHKKVASLHHKASQKIRETLSSYQQDSQMHTVAFESPMKMRYQMRSR